MNEILTKDFIIEQYCNLHKSSNVIAKEIGCCNRTVLNYMKMHEIPRRRKGSNADINGKSARFEDLTGLVFIDHKMISAIKSNNGLGRSWKWRGECVHCGNKKNFVPCKLKSGRSGKCFKCKNHYNWNGVGDISGSYIKYVRIRAKSRGQEYSVSNEYIWDIFLKQQKRCALTCDFIYFAKSYKKYCDQTASLDRIDSTKGYVEGNVQWLHKDVNRCKWDFTQEEFIEMCKKVVACNNI